MMNTLKFEERDGVGILTLSRPSELNALSTEMLEELSNFFDSVKVNSLVITGDGDKSFCAGADIQELFSLSNSYEAYEYLRRGQRVFCKIETSVVPTVAAINGYALGGGLELALSCTFRIASKKAKLGQPEINLGIIPGYGGTQRLTRIIGFQRAKYLVTLGKHLDAETSLSWGLVDEIVEPDRLMERAIKIANELSEKEKLALRYGAESCQVATSYPLDEGLKMEATLCSILLMQPQAKSLMQRFLEKKNK